MPSLFRPGHLYRPHPARLRRRQHLRRHLQRARSHVLGPEYLPCRQHRRARQLGAGEGGRDERVEVYERESAVVCDGERTAAGIELSVQVR